MINHIIVAEQYIRSIPSYVSPSPDANDSLTKAEAAYQEYSWSWIFSVQNPDPQNLNGTVAFMRRAVDALLFGPDNNTPPGTSLADDALNKAKLWNATQEPLARKQLLAPLVSARNSFQYSILPTMGMLALALIFVLIKTLGSVMHWAKTIRLPSEWQGQLDTKVMVFVNAALIFGGFQLINAISQLPTYQSTPNLSLMYWCALIGSCVGAGSIVVIFKNSSKPNRKLAFLAVTLFVFTIAVYLIVTWTLYPLFFGPVNV